MLLLGLDNAGKSTLLSKLKTGKLGRFAPTQRPVVEDVEVGNVRIRCFDLGGHAAGREVWRDYCAQTDVIIFLVDSADRARLEEAAESLWNVVEGEKSEEQKKKLLLVMGNKIDRPDIATADELHSTLRLAEASKFFRATSLFQVSLYTGAGYQESFKWIEDNL